MALMCVERQMDEEKMVRGTVVVRWADGQKRMIIVMMKEVENSKMGRHKTTTLWQMVATGLVKIT